MRKLNEKDLILSAIEDYKNPDGRLFEYGLCYYFYKKHKVDLKSDNTFKSILPNLYSLMPKDCESTFWFPAGDTKSRLEILQKALELC